MLCIVGINHAGRRLKWLITSIRTTNRYKGIIVCYF